MIPLYFHAEAKEEASAAVTYYETQQAGLGKRFIDVLADTLHRIQTNPRLFPIVEGNIRKCRIIRFPYGIIYRCRRNKIEILAVMHLHRKPGYWKSRI
jgi:plasmid stabilization system protein ParE